MNWNPGINLLHRPPFPEMSFSGDANIGSVANTHYLRARILDSDYIFTSACTGPPAYTQPAQYGQTLFEAFGRWPINADSGFIGRTLIEFYQWRITSLSNLTRTGGSMVVNTWYDFVASAGTYQDMTMNYVGGGNGVYTVQVRRKDTTTQVYSSTRTIVEP